MHKYHVKYILNRCIHIFHSYYFYNIYIYIDLCLSYMRYMYNFFFKSPRAILFIFLFYWGITYNLNTFLYDPTQFLLARDDSYSKHSPQDCREIWTKKAPCSFKSISGRKINAPGRLSFIKYDIEQQIHEITLYQ